MSPRFHPPRPFSDALRYSIDIWAANSDSSRGARYVDVSVSGYLHGDFSRVGLVTAIFLTLSKPYNF